MNRSEIEYKIFECKENITIELNKVMAGIKADTDKIHQYTRELEYWQASLKYALQ